MPPFAGSPDALTSSKQAKSGFRRSGGSIYTRFTSVWPLPHGR